MLAVPPGPGFPVLMPLVDPTVPTVRSSASAKLTEPEMSAARMSTSFVGSVNANEPVPNNSRPDAAIAVD